MTGLDLQTLEDLRIQALALKQSFSKTETKTWTATIVASELVLQTTHLQYALMSPDAQHEVYPTSSVDKGVADELSDVLFNAAILKII